MDLQSICLVVKCHKCLVLGCLQLTLDDILELIQLLDYVVLALI